MNGELQDLPFTERGEPSYPSGTGRLCRLVPDGAFQLEGRQSGAAPALERRHL